MLGSPTLRILGYVALGLAFFPGHWGSTEVLMLVKQGLYSLRFIISPQKYTLRTQNMFSSVGVQEETYVKLAGFNNLK